MKRVLLFTASNTFPLLGSGATLSGCLNDSAEKKTDCLGPWRKQGWDGAYDLREGVDNADNVRERLDELIAGLNADSGVGVMLICNSSHGTPFTDRITGDTVSCTVCHDSTWDNPASFVSKQDYQRAFQKLKPGKRVFFLLDSCESGNMGESFKLIENFNVSNRWIEPPADVHRSLSPVVEVRYSPKQVCTMAGCAENGTCADVHDSIPHGLFSRTFNETVLSNPQLSWSKLAAAINAKMDGQTCVPNGPDWTFLQES